MGWGMFWTQTRTFRPLLAVSVSPPGDCDLECGLACLAGMDATEKHLGLEQAHLSGSYKHFTLLGSSSRTNHVPATTLQHGMCYFSLNSSATGAFPPPPPYNPPHPSPSKYPSAQLCLMNSDVHIILCIRQITGSDYAPHDPVQSDLCFSQLKLSQKTAMRFSLKNRELYYYY